MLEHTPSEQLPAGVQPLLMLSFREFFQTGRCLASGRGGMGVSQLNNSPLLTGLENRYGQKLIFSHKNFTIMGAKMAFSHYARG